MFTQTQINSFMGYITSIYGRQKIQFLTIDGTYFRCLIIINRQQIDQNNLYCL